MRSLNEGSSSVTSTAQQQKRRRPLHLMSEIETMMNRKTHNGGSRKTTAAATTAVVSSSACGGGGEVGSFRRPRQRRQYNKRDDDDNNNDDCVHSATEDIGSTASSSTLSFIHNSHHGLNNGSRIYSSVFPSRLGTRWGYRPSLFMNKNSFLYGGLFVLCGIASYTIFLMDGLNHHHHYTYDLAAAAAASSSSSAVNSDQNYHSSNRQLSFLDSIWNDYGKDSFHFEYLLPPSELDLTVSRRLPIHTQVPPDDTVTPDDGLCDNILLFLPDSFARNGHGSQLNSYILAAEMATYLNKAMVLYDAPQKVQKFKGGSQFGCPKDSLVGGERHVLMKEQKEGERPKGTRGWVDNFPRGLERLIQHPDWLSRKCPIPCQDEFKYWDWENIRTSQHTNYTDPESGRKDWKFDIQEVTCKSSQHRRDTNVLVVGGYELRKYFDQEIKDKMVHRVPSSPVSGIDSAIESANGGNSGGGEDGKDEQDGSDNNQHAYDWAVRLGASAAEAKAFVDLDQEKDIWDFVSALMARSGIIRFQPWIARDAEEFIKNAGLPLNVDYDSIHVRRGDKLLQEAKREVNNFWRARGYGSGTGKQIPRDFIPFSHYVGQGYHKTPCNADGEPHLVYVATDDPRVVQKELSFFKKNDAGHTVMNDCHKFNFMFGPMPKNDIPSHLNAEGGHRNCVHRYQRNIAGIADLLILAKSNLFVGEFNSNWGRLVRVFRMRLNDELIAANGPEEVEGDDSAGSQNRRRTAKTVVHPVLTKGLKVAWGNRHPGPLGL